ncbi:MAG: hypothetical protein AB7P21_26155 [Lautropia sp.]
MTSAQVLADYRRQARVPVCASETPAARTSGRSRRTTAPGPWC